MKFLVVSLFLLLQPCSSEETFHVTGFDCRESDFIQNISLSSNQDSTFKSIHSVNATVQIIQKVHVSQVMNYKLTILKSEV